MVKTLREAGILEWDYDDDGRRRPGVNADLGEDFSIHHALSLYLIDILEKRDEWSGRPFEESETYALDVLTFVESILEDPEPILRRQLDKLKSEKIAELKAAGVEYDDRMAELEKLEYPKPNRELVYDSFNEFARKHPWVKTENIRPKSIAREMVESVMSFTEYVREYGLERVEGLLLRYLSDVYKTLVQTVPAWAKDHRVEEIITTFGAVVRQVDSSLLDEWERLKNPYELFEPAPVREELEPAGSMDVTKDEKAFTVLVRNEVFRLVRALARRDFTEAARIVAPAPEVEAQEAASIEKALQPFFEAHGALRVDPEARSPKHTMIERGETARRVRQVLLDSEDDNDWFFDATIDLARSRDAARPVLALERIGC
jgi:superfamily II RNA helicase